MPRSRMGLFANDGKPLLYIKADSVDVFFIYLQQQFRINALGMFHQRPANSGALRWAGNKQRADKIVLHHAEKAEQLAAVFGEARWWL